MPDLTLNDIVILGEVVPLSGNDADTCMVPATLMYRSLERTITESLIQRVNFSGEFSRQLSRSVQIVSSKQ